MSEKPKQEGGLMTREVAGEMMVYDAGGRRMHVLNGSARFVWDACTGEQTVDEIVASVVAQFGIDPDVAQRDVTTCVATFTERGMLA